MGRDKSEEAAREGGARPGPGRWERRGEETETLISHCQSNDFSECCSTVVRASCVAGPVFDMLKITKRSNGKP